MTDYSELHDQQINMMVCKALGLEMSGYARITPLDDATILLADNETLVDYCNNPADAWPIIVENRISIIIDDTCTEWSSASVQDYCDESAFKYPSMHANPLRAAMMTFLMIQDANNANA